MPTSSCPPTMSRQPFSSVGASESPEVRLQSRLSLGHQLSQFSDLLVAQEEQLREIKANIPRWKHNAEVLASRFNQLVRNPSDFAPLAFSVYSLFLSLIPLILSGGKPGIEFLYPLSSLTRRESFGRLARLILDHSRNLQQPNLHHAIITEQGFDPPRVAVVDLNDVPQCVIDHGYDVPADINGFMIMFMILEILFELYSYILAPIKTTNKYPTLLLAEILFGGRMFVFLANWAVPLSIIVYFGLYAVLDGDGTLTLVRRSGPVTPGHAVFLDREFIVILSGSLSVVEAIMESGFTLNTPSPFPQLTRNFRHNFLLLRYEALNASCNGLFLSFFLGIYLASRPSLIAASAALVLAIVISSVWSWVQLSEIRRDSKAEDWIPVFIMLSCLTYGPSWFLFFLPVSEQYLVEIMLEIVPQWPALIPLILFLLFTCYDQDFPVHTTKFLDILGNPPIRRWEFDTMAAAATFQCLVLCRGLPHPIKAFDVLALLDISIPNQTEVWMAWKNRVADRITHEAEILFAPTLPTFGDQRQERLKELLDQAQVGYDAYRKFYDRHDSTKSLL